MDNLEGSAVVDEKEAEPRRTSRRRLFQRGAIGAAAVAGVAVADVLASSSPSGAADGGNMLIGEANSSSAQTSLTNSAGGTGFAVTTALTGISGTSTGSSTVGFMQAGVAGSGAPGVIGTAGTSGSAGVIGNGAPGIVGNGATNVNPGVQGNNTHGGPALGLSTSGSAAGPLAVLGQSNPPSAIPPTSGSWQVGNVVQKGGHLYYCYSTGNGNTTSKWDKLSGSLVILPAPIRAYDSRNSSPLAAGSTRNISLTSALPAGASAVLMNLTAASPTGPGNLAVYSAAVSYPGTSNINFVANVNIANNATSAVSSGGSVTVRCAGSQTDFVIDVLGYYP